MYKLLLILFIIPSSLYISAQTFPEVRTAYDSGKVLQWMEPQDLSNLTFMGKVPVTWENNSIAKPKMTCALLGGNVLYERQKGGYEAYSSYKIDITLVQKIVSSKDKFKILDKLTIEKGPQNFQSQKQENYAKLENARIEGEWVLVDGKIPGESIKIFLVTRANDTQLVLKTYNDQRIINYIIQVN